MSPSKTLDQASVSTAFISCVQSVIDRMSKQLSYTSDPTSVVQDIIEYNSRLRTPGLSKFNEPCYVASVNFHTSEQTAKSGDAIGALVFYLEESSVGKFLKALGHKGFSEDDEAVMLEKCGEFCHVVADEFKKTLADFGAGSLVLSKPQIGRNEIAEGVAFDYDEYKYLEFNFFLWKQKTLVFDLTFSKLNFPPK
jgi:hypothetical protein